MPDDVSTESRGGISPAVRCALSVVISNHDYGQFVGAAIESALHQRDVDVDVVVVDDGSTDCSLEVMARYADSVTIVRSTNAGQGSAMNLGFAMARGEAIIFLDADDVLAPDIGRRVLAELDADPAVARVQFALDVIDRDGTRTGELMPATPERLFSGDATTRLLTCPDDIVWQPTSGNAFRRAALEQILPMPAEPFRLCADYYLSSLTPLHGPVAVLQGSGGGYRVHGGNGHFSNRASTDRLRANLMRTYETHRCLIAEAERIGRTGMPSDPGRVHSVTFAGTRLLSYRLDRAGHPIAGDSRAGLLAFGLASAMRRTDVSALRRAAFAAWFVALALAPQTMLGLVARPFVALDRTAGAAPSKTESVSTADGLGTAAADVRGARRRR